MDGPLISLRSLDPIKKGAEVFISYIDHTNPYTVRQAELKDRYCFACECTKCLLGPTQREDQWLRPVSQLPAKLDLLGGIPYGETDFAKNPVSGSPSSVLNLLSPRPTYTHTLTSETTRPTSSATPPQSAASPESKA